MKRTTFPIRNIALLAIGAACTTGCCKDTTIPEPWCEAGTGGNITLVLKPEHHGTAILSQSNYPDTAYLKFNVNEFPGDNASFYSVIAVGTTGADSVVVNGLRCGYYYVFMTGFDTNIAERVKGGIPVYVEPDEETQTLVIPVTED